jgi:hypothetical protein
MIKLEERELLAVKFGKTKILANYLTLLFQEVNSARIYLGIHKVRGKYHCTIDLQFDWFELVRFANKNKNCPFSYS